MAYITPADIKTRFPQFDSLENATLQIYIDDTKCNFDVSRWGCLYTRGHSLYVAHLMTVYNAAGSGVGVGTGAGGPVSAEAADSVSRAYASYNPMTAAEAFLMQTPFGQEFLSLRRTVGIGATCINSCNRF